jgi:pyrophosphatase PpaX
MKSYDTYLFDADGTLIDTAELIFQSFLYTCKKYGDFTIDKSRVISGIGQPLAQQIQEYLGRLSETELATVLEDYRDYQLDIYGDHLSIFPEVQETLTTLKQNGKQMAVVTSRKMDTAELYLKTCNLFDLFNVIITPESTSKHKPHPEPALKALEAIDGKAGNALFIGDAYFDIECGQKAGTDTAFVSWSLNDPDTIKPAPTYVIQKMSDLLT